MNQWIGRSESVEPHDVVGWMGAVQAQDYLGALWAVGVRGLLFRDAAPEALVTALTAAAARLAVLDPALARTLIAPAERPTAALLEALTPRELEVLHHLADRIALRF